jgi:uncharacterized protein YukE
MNAHSPAHNPYARVWAEAEHALRQEIQRIHALGVEVDSSRRGLHWRGDSAERFHTRAQARHQDLHAHNDTLRYLLSLVRLAQTLHPAKGAAQ